jgi:hypothetical protein
VSLGVLFGIGNMVGMALYVVGFAETIVGLVKDIAGDDVSLTGAGDLNDIRVYGLISCVFILMLCLAGVDWVVKVQLGLLGVLVIAIISFFVGISTKENVDKLINGISQVRSATPCDDCSCCAWCVHEYHIKHHCECDTTLSAYTNLN